MISEETHLRGSGIPLAVSMYQMALFFFCSAYKCLQSKPPARISILAGIQC